MGVSHAAVTLPRMALLRTFTDSEYSPEFGTLMLRDHWSRELGDTPEPDDDPPREYPEGTQPTGTLTRSGYGWLEGSARGGYHIVTLELHDSEPPDDRREWTDVGETPYRSGTGTVGLTMVTGGPGRASLDLGASGRYAVRVSRRRARAGEVDDPEGTIDHGDMWRLQFRPDPAGAVPPRRLIRGAPATGRGDPGWHHVLPYALMELTGIVRAAIPDGADSATGPDIDRWTREHGRPAGWMDEPLWPERTAGPPMAGPSTGSPELGAGSRQRSETANAHNARVRARIDQTAALLGVPAPRTRRQALPLLVATCMLAVDSTGGVPRYRVGEPVRAGDVLDLPPDEARLLAVCDAMARYRSFAADVVSIVVWAADSPAAATVESLSAQLLATVDEVRSTLEYTVDRKLLAVAGDPADPQACLLLSLYVPLPPAPPPAPRAAPAPYDVERMRAAQLDRVRARAGARRASETFVEGPPAKTDPGLARFTDSPAGRGDG